MLQRMLDALRIVKPLWGSAPGSHPYLRAVFTEYGQPLETHPEVIANFPAHSRSRSPASKSMQAMF